MSRSERDDREDDLLETEELYFDLLGECQPEARQTHEGIPICGYCGGEPIPDLNALAQEQWLDVLRPLSSMTRIHATSRLHSPAEAQVGMEIRGQLWLEDATPSARADAAAPPRMPAGAPPGRGASRQINFRVGPDEHARLVAASKLFAMRPTTLARVLTMRGVDRALYEERRDR